MMPTLWSWRFLRELRRKARRSGVRIVEQAAPQAAVCEAAGTGVRVPVDAQHGSCSAAHARAGGGRGDPGMSKKIRAFIGYLKVLVNGETLGGGFYRFCRCMRVFWYFTACPMYLSIRCCWGRRAT